MLKSSKIVALIATAAGTVLAGGCGLNGFAEGFFAKGFIDKWWVDVITDWLNEDLFG
jgi:hypothetical protein